MQYQDTTAFAKIEAMNARLNIIQGGARAGKTIAILMLLCDLTIPFSGMRDKVIHVVSDTLPNLRHGAMYDWERMLKGTGRAPYFTVNKTEHKWTNILTGTSVEFLSCDAEDALGAPRDFLFVNEANRISRSVFDQLILRTTERVWIDFNPVNEFWAHQLMKERTDWQFLKLTYLDNEAIPEPILNELLQHKGDGTNNFWRVYGLGEIGSLEGNVYEGWIPVEKIPEGFILKRYGVDFGFNDPTVIEGVYEGEYDDTPNAILAKTECYKPKLTAPDIVAICKTLPGWEGAIFVCDNARPEVIAEMRRGGIRAVGSNKTPGEKMNGKRYNIDLVQRRKVLYLASDKDLEREYLTYAWRKKKTGETLDEPEDGNDHCLPYDTKVDTIYGQIPIGELVGTKGWVFTEGGKLRYYRNVRKTGDERILTITLSNGEKFRCSEDHPVYTVNRGIVPAKLLTRKDKVQLIGYESRDNQPNEAKVQRLKLLERLKGTVLQKCQPQTALTSQSGLGISQWKDTRGTSNRPHRPEYGQQPDRKLASGYKVGQQSKCRAGGNAKKAGTYGRNSRQHEGMARFGGGEEMALRAWQARVSEERANRKNLCRLWEKILYKTALREGAFMQPKLSTEGTLATSKGCSGRRRRQNRKEVRLLWQILSHFLPKTKVLLSEMQEQDEDFAEITAIEVGEVEPVYCMDVYDTSNFSIEGGVVVSNCMDALSYAVRDMQRKPLVYGEVR